MVLIQGQSAAVPPQWHWIVSDDQIMVAADPAATVEDGEWKKTLSLITYHRRPLDGADILHWRVEYDCLDHAGQAIVTHRRTIDTPAAEGGKLASDGPTPSLLTTAARTFCRLQYPSPRDDHSMDADQGLAGAGGIAGAARGTWRHEGPTGDWRTVGEFQKTYGLVARDMGVRWQIGSWWAHRYAVAGVIEEDDREVVRTFIATVFVDCSINAATLVDGHQLDDAGRREPGQFVASTWFDLDREARFGKAAEVGAELSRMAWRSQCRNQPPAAGASFADVRRFTEHAERQLASGIDKP